MFATPTSSPQITRMFGLRPDAAGGAGAGAAVGAAGAAFCACANAPEVIAAAATSADEPSRILRRLRVRSSFSLVEVSCRPLSVSSDMQHSFRTVRTNGYCVAAVLFTQRNPT